MPGTNPAEAMRVVAGELPDFPYLPELPDRGPGADLTGRTAALLVDIPAEVTPRGWRMAERPGRALDARRHAGAHAHHVCGAVRPRGGGRPEHLAGRRERRPRGRRGQASTRR